MGAPSGKDMELGLVQDREPEKSDYPKPDLYVPDPLSSTGRQRALSHISLLSQEPSRAG